MPRTDNQRHAFNFLNTRYSSQIPFTKQEFIDATGWEGSTFDTYLGKQFRDLLVPIGHGFFRVHLGFRRFGTWPKFRDNVVTQNRKLVRAYEPATYDNVISFEFFMPLRNEEYLRDALDILFYRDSLMARLRILDVAEVRQQFPELDDLNDDALQVRACEWLASKFGGYSISHVSGWDCPDFLYTLRGAWVEV